MLLGQVDDLSTVDGTRCEEEGYDVDVGQEGSLRLGWLVTICLVKLKTYDLSTVDVTQYGTTVNTVNNGDEGVMSTEELRLRTAGWLFTRCECTSIRSTFLGP